MCQCFNPHTHAGCDQSTPYSLSHYSEFQSTHPRRVWLSNITNISNMEVSIHTPTQGVTRVDDRTSMLLSVSIHTPTQGVTKKYLREIPVVGFNPHTHAGCDLCILVLGEYYWMFQSTHPRRVWHVERIRAIVLHQFQSTHPRRVWRLVIKVLPRQEVSIHTPTQGVTSFSRFP